MKKILGTTLTGAYRAMRRRLLESVLTGGSPSSLSQQRNDGREQAALRFRLAGRQVLISGASSGIGRACALKAAEAGAHVLLLARSQEKLDALCAEIEQAGGQARAYPVDLSSESETRALLTKLLRERRRVDVLINNAGRSIRRPVVEAYERVHDYERTMALNYFGSLRLILGLVPGMRARGNGHVINVSSAGVQVGTPLFSAYIASKAALDAFTRVAASEMHGDGVRFSTVHMPLVRTAMIAPTQAYRDVEALTPEQAADMVLRVLITHERQVGTRLARLTSLAHVLMPDVLEYVLSLGHRLDGSARLPLPA
jgi:short-subunit dehydrogenase